MPRTTRFQRELLELWGIGEDEIVNSDEVRHVRAETLVVPGPGLDHRAQPALGLAAAACPAGAARASSRVPGPEPLPVPQGRAEQPGDPQRGRGAGAAGPLGFEVVDPGDFSVVDQIRIFAEADVIVAPHGASLANMPFCSPGASLLELFPSQSMVADYWKMTCGVEGLEYQYLSGTGPAAGIIRRASSWSPTSPSTCRGWTRWCPRCWRRAPGAAAR